MRPWIPTAEVVIKYGGAAMVESPERTMRDVAALAAMGLKPVTGTQRGPNGEWLREWQVTKMATYGKLLYKSMLYGNTHVSYFSSM